MKMMKDYSCNGSKSPTKCVMSVTTGKCGNWRAPCSPCCCEEEPKDTTERACRYCSVMPPMARRKVSTVREKMVPCKCSCNRMCNPY